MATTCTRLRLLIAALTFCLAATLGAPVMAQQQKQPTEVNPMAQSVKERELLKELNKIQGRTTLRTPGRAFWNSPPAGTGASSTR